MDPTDGGNHDLVCNLTLDARGGGERSTPAITRREPEYPDPVREALWHTLVGLETQVPNWLPPAIVESWGDEDGVGAHTRPEISAGNLRWMLAHAKQHIHVWPTDKLSGWIGFVQGVLACQSRDFSVQEERDRTRPLFHYAYKLSGQVVPVTFQAPSFSFRPQPTAAVTADT